MACFMHVLQCFWKAIQAVMVDRPFPYYEKFGDDTKGVADQAVVLLFKS